ncbi:MAG: hypothetical protein JXB39_13375 [Deltaproteobacteria bacterium]|nr:hypothetical protein [Deltaproteobacteria bacterium]
MTMSSSRCPCRPYPGAGSLAAALLAFALPASAVPFRYAEDLAPGIVHPLYTTTMAEARISELVFDGLYTDDPQLASTPGLALSAGLSPDGREMTVRLREDVTWHDGAPFTARDVVFTIQAMKDASTLSTESGRVAWIDQAVLVDAHTVRLVFRQPERRPEDKLHFKILPAHLFPETPIRRTGTFRHRPVGTGPYKVISFNEDNSITMRAVSGEGDPAGLAEVAMREVSDKNYQAKLLLYESLEALVRVLPRDLAVLQNHRKVELYPYQTNSWWYLGFNLDRTPYDEPSVRQAIAALIDIDALLAPIGTGDVVSGPYVPSSPYCNHQVPRFEHQPSQADALLSEAGFVKEARTWTRNGQPLRLKVVSHRTLESSQEVVINLQSQLREAGIGVEPEFLDDASWKARIWRERDYDLVLSQWTFDRSEDVYDQFHSSGTRNFTGYANPEVDTLLEKARTTTDPQVKKTALREVHRLVHDDVPMVFLWTLDSYAAFSSRVHNVVIHPFYFFTWVQNWRME